MLLQVVVVVFIYFFFFLFNIVYKFSVVCSFVPLTSFLFLDLP